MSSPSQAGIKQLLEAETKAQEIINKAKKGLLEEIYQILTILYLSFNLVA
jgi:hypothetical protein